ncbi:NAD(P)H-binding protein [Kribbella jiaozuonensis]|uniref:NAD-dependent epimerase/dehydratase family protein n=1 Tax=Kribbella jiaozuonensis TaxID=2575441 RepID=A0A4V5UXH4_9ACTN|nr:NAD(P)H-binding protein [Kribbella jiaozuonensis]TKK72823.1 NAD-dependent epimerase/dehydratase family protein [Kribbella jiaozuonensis]TKK78503.1 NAD-dependent epimerase/dehydratase family protein [Kribbella jiaozuonensis]
MRILVTGATGRVGRHVVDGLRAAGVTVRALVRTPELAGFPPEVELIQGDITDADAVRRASADVDAAFLLWPSFSADGAGEIVPALPSRVVYLSSLNAAEGGVWGDVERLLRDAGKAWTFLRPSGFAVNAQSWAEDFRSGDTLRLPYPEASRSMIHERDIAAVAVLSFVNPGHVGQIYELTGPEALTQAEQVATIGRAVGKDLHVVPLTEDAARQAMLDQGADPALAASAVSYWASLVDNPEPVTTTVTELTGRPALTFTEWAHEHADEFRILSTPEVAHGYADALSSGRLDTALTFLAPDIIRTAPLESTTELKGVAAILENIRRLNADVEYLAVETLGPLLHDNHFAIRFTFTQRNTQTGARSQTTKLSLCTVESGQITREEVFYNTPAPS